MLLYSNSLQPSCSTCSQTSPNGLKPPNLEQQTPNPPKYPVREIVKTDISALLQKRYLTKLKQPPPRPEAGIDHDYIFSWTNI